MLLLFAFQRADETRLLSHEAADLARVECQIVARELKAVNSDLLYLSEEHSVRSFLVKPDARRRAVMAEQFRLFCARKGIYDQIRYLDASGMERVRVNYDGGVPTVVPPARLQQKAQRYYFNRSFARTRGSTYVSPFDLNVEHDRIEQPLKPVIRFATPVFDAGGSKRGIVILNYMGALLIRKVDEVASNFSGSVLLVNPEGYWLRGPRPADDWGFMFGRPPLFARAHPDVWRAMRSAPRGERATSHGWYAFATPASPAGAAPILHVLVFVPAGVLHRRSAATLRTLLVVYGVVVALLAVLCGSLASAASVRHAQRLVLHESEQRLRAMSTRLINAQEDERRSISRDLHDDLGQLLTAIGLDLERALELTDESRRRAAMLRARDSTREVLDRVQEISQRLRPRMLDELGLKDAIQHFLADCHARSGLETHAEIRTGDRLPDAVSQAIYRIVQEAVGNVLKHTRASRVVVALNATGGTADLVVEDDGSGFLPEAAVGSSLGILDMRERAELLRGTFDLTTAPGQGTVIRVSIPTGEPTGEG